MRKPLHVLGWLVSLASVVFFARALSLHWSAIQATGWTASDAGAALAALVLYATTLVLAGQGWALILAALGDRHSIASSRRIVLVSQIAKYLPGNVGHHVGRVVLAGRAGIAPELAIVSLSIEMAIALAIGALLSLPLLATAAGSRIRASVDARGVLVAAAAVVLVAAVVAIAVPAVRRRMGGIARRLVEADRSRLAPVVALQASSFVLGGTALYVLCLGGAADAPWSWGMWASVVGAYAAAWTAGFVAPGAPAGLGVREVVLATVLTPLFGAATALAAPAILRLVTVLGDGAMFLLARTYRSSEERDGMVEQ